ncbi:MAG: DUF3298 domain-containing protein [Pyrinomonadaceae bacterium]
MRNLIFLLSMCLAVAFGCSNRQAGSGNQAQPAAEYSAAAASPAGVAPVAPTPDANVKVYRGSLGSRGLEMKLKREGQSVSGSYAYDGIGQEIGLEGRATGKEKVELAEKDAAGKVTGRWSCEAAKEGEWDQDFNCKWTKPNGTGEQFVALYEQTQSASAWRVAPKVIENRKVGARASYPQIVAGAQLSTAAAHFNGLLEKKITKQVADFAEGMEGEKNLYFHTDYNTLLATDDLISVELAYDSYAGGVHPESSYDAVTYDLRADREVKLEDLFKPRSGYEKTIADYCLKEINRRAAEPEEEPPVTEEQLEEIGGFAVTPRGLMIYYDLPHVIAAFDRNFVPYTVVKNLLKPDGTAAALAK